MAGCSVFDQRATAMAFRWLARRTAFPTLKRHAFK